MININIVEDQSGIRNKIQTYFNHAVSDMQCKQTYEDAETAEGGLLLYQPDVVIMDIGLPKMNGIECMIKVKQHNLAIKFLMFTVFEDDEHVFEALKAGADGYILKKESLSKIENAIREITQGGAPMSKSIAMKVLQSFRQAPQIKKRDLEKLSPRQKEILEKLSKGYPYKLIAEHLEIEIGTVKQHIHKIYKKLHVNNKTEAINKYLGR